MTGPHDRRGFLRGLASLPLIGGGVTLIGRPVAAAVPVTDALQERYLTWLAHEHMAAVKEHAYRKSLEAALRWGPAKRECSPEAYARGSEECAGYVNWMPPAPDIEAMTKLTRPSTRAAVILSAAGVPLR
ncbi:hypothetical protein [Enterovirga rhinocerotis]|uniref:Uncharacterized protein n=1 Tax=Enterovirga rhinocerotis TaxID=1339210 RepID=A0A4R7C6P8_9HYPH|nr:hypothetical protein [Enterovirga rhinocerotis]TDR93813.1 hypothetical protein EV668_1080 [Enterovirga rhinocerotis]